MDIDADVEGSAYTALKKDGTLWIWGTNNMGQFAQSNLEKSDVPLKIMDGVISVSGLAALKKDGSVWTWGGDKFYNAAIKTNKPVIVYKGAKAIAYGYNFIYIIDNKGVLYAVTNQNSDLSKKLKTKTIKISENVTFVNMNYFIKSDKSLWRFSVDEQGKVRTTPVMKNVVYADSNYVSNCAIKDDGTLWVGGLNHTIFPPI
jgi:alpha-tubulin suppressor-like RCC1 family protein